ncbi:MAG: NAD(P)-dependent alcohol dehydrogenase [Candidatus Thorarchaeota archaeon]
MKAVVATKYGSPEVLKIEEIDTPSPKTDEVLIKIYATSLHRGDSRVRGLDVPDLVRKILARLYLGIRRPGKKNGILGMELSGKIEAIGQDVTKFSVGDEIFAFTLPSGWGAHAEYVTLKEDAVLTYKPSNMTWEEAAVMPAGGITTLAIIKMANIKNGQKVLIYGASGSIGTFAVQLAKSLGAEVTGVCSTSNLEFVRSVGADKVIDYKTTDFTELGETYDVIFDAVALYEGDYKKALKNTGIYLNVDKSSGKIKKKDFLPLLKELKELCETGKVKGVISRTYTLDQIVEAYRYVDTGRKRANVAISVAAKEK